MNMQTSKSGQKADPFTVAEDLILQLPNNHNGRNNWLINHGKSTGAEDLRSQSQVIKSNPGTMLDFTPAY
jgi:hypothetical protein